jgi:hypothetical protein
VGRCVDRERECIELCVDTTDGCVDTGSTWVHACWLGSTLLGKQTADVNNCRGMYRCGVSHDGGMHATHMQAMVNMTVGWVAA